MKATFAMSRSHGGVQARDAAARFAARLSAASALEVELVIEPDYDRLFEAVLAGRVSMAWLPPLLYSRAAVAGLTLVAVPERRGGVAYYSAILVSDAASYASEAALVGVRAAWVDPKSASGYAFPRQHLISAGATFAEETFHGSPNESAAQVAAGRADVCTCPVSSTLPVAAQKHMAKVLGSLAGQLRILAITGMIPPDGLVISRAAPAEIARPLSAAVFRLHDDPAGVAAIRDLFGADRMVTPVESTRRMISASS